MIDEIETEDGAPVDEAAEQERRRLEAAATKWLEKIEAGRKHDKDEREKWARWRAFVADKPEGEYGEERTFLVDAPLLQSVIETTMANIYANKPDVSVTPAEAVQEAQYEQVKDFGKTAEIVASRMMEDGDLRSTIKRASLSAMTNCIGWVKPLLQLDKRTDPLIARQISDVQDNLRQIEALVAELQDAAACAESEAKRAELQDQLRALQSQAEVEVARGAAFDFIRADDMQIDPECREVIDYRMADWIAQRQFLSTEKAKADFGLSDEQIATATLYAKRNDDGGYEKTTSPHSKGEVAVWEVWDRVATTVHTLIEGMKGYARPPYSPTPVSRRFYPFFALAFHWVDGLRWPRSDVDLGHKVQEEASRALSNFAEHRRRVRPKIFFNRGQLSSDDVRKIEDAENLELVGLDPTDPTQDLARLLFVPAYPQVDPGLYDITPYRQVLEELFGLSETRRGGVIKTKTLGEAEMVEQGSETRMDWRRSAVEELITDVARYLIELALQAMPLEEAQRYAGAGAMWPKLDKDDIYALVSIQIRGGSTGKPDTRAEREAWGTLMPIIDKAVTEIAGLLSNPMTVPLADVKIELLKETVRRLDDRIDVTRFIPKVQPMPVAPAMPGAAPVTEPPTPMAA